jgi:hypothetical protein
VERFYGEYFFRLRVIWRIVRKAIFNNDERKRLTKEAREYLALRSKRKKFVAAHKAAAKPRPRPQVRATDPRMTHEHARLRLKTWSFAVGRSVQQRLWEFLPEARHAASLATPLEYITVLFHPWVALGVLLMIVWMLSRMALLSWADLSYVLPVTAVGYVLVAIVGKVLLNERITMQALGRNRADRGGRGAGQRRQRSPDQGGAGGPMKWLLWHHRGGHHGG